MTTGVFARCVTGCVLLALELSGQTAASPARPSFEAAVIKPAKDYSGHTGSHSDPGMINLQSTTLKGLIAMAYSVRQDQVAGGPKWMESARFDITAKTENKTGNEQMMQMLQSLLAERFQLTLHREKKMVAGYSMTVAKGGIKMTKAEGDSSSSQGGKGTLTAKGLSMFKLADRLSRQLGDPVIDQTALSGGYDFKLEWSVADDSSIQNLIAAVQEQLGLKLQSIKTSVELLIVDRAEKPSDN
jgi:uncharacterized protein (TIGR03435 family)